MGATYDTLIAVLTDKYDDATNDYVAANSYWNQAVNHYLANQDHEAIYDILQCLFEMLEGGGRILALGFYGWNGATHALTTALDRNKACPFDGEVTIGMDDILSAMITATDEEYQYFIGLVDAYRVALWNKPFNAEFYAALARGFAE